MQSKNDKILAMSIKGAEFNEVIGKILTPNIFKSWYKNETAKFLEIAISSQSRVK